MTGVLSLIVAALAGAVFTLATMAWVVSDEQRTDRLRRWLEAAEPRRPVRFDATPAPAAGPLARLYRIAVDLRAVVELPAERAGLS